MGYSFKNLLKAIAIVISYYKARKHQRNNNNSLWENDDGAVYTRHVIFLLDSYLYVPMPIRSPYLVFLLHPCHLCNYITELYQTHIKMS